MSIKSSKMSDITTTSGKQGLKSKFNKILRVVAFIIRNYVTPTGYAVDKKTKLQICNVML